MRVFVCCVPLFLIYLVDKYKPMTMILELEMPHILIFFVKIIGILILEVTLLEHLKFYNSMTFSILVTLYLELKLKTIS